MTAVVFLDTETTGLDPDRHAIWELACIVRDHRDESFNGEWLWQLKPDLTVADPIALRIGQYYQRNQLWRAEPSRAVTLATPWWTDKQRDVPYPSEATSAVKVAHILASMLDGVHLVGAVPSFDAAFLTRFLRGHGEAPTWHYHLVDVEALAAGLTQIEPPWDSEKLSAAVGVEPDRFAKHTALGDAHWACAVYDAVMAEGRQP
jgi:hypothetical protein